jgi:hypothetical protein
VGRAEDEIRIDAKDALGAIEGLGSPWDAVQVGAQAWTRHAHPSPEPAATARLG